MSGELQIGNKMIIDSKIWKLEKGMMRGEIGRDEKSYYIETEYKGYANHDLDSKAKTRFDTLTEASSIYDIIINVYAKVANLLNSIQNVSPNTNQTDQNSSFND